LTKHKVIFDTDPGIDDAMALLYLHHHPDIELLGITTVFGNARIETTTRNALFLKQAWNIEAPVAKGAGVTYDRTRTDREPPTIVHGDNGLGNIELPETIEVPLDPRPAHQFLIETIKAHPGEIELVAVGRMTNLALALQEAPEIAGLVKQVVIMGGGITANGNVTPVAEANIHGDPEAADIVMTAPWKVVLIGLDVTARTIMTRSQLADIGKAGGARAQLVVDVSQYYVDFYETVVPDGMMVHDSCAAAYVTNPELFTMQSGAIRVVCGGIADGQTIQKADGRGFPPNDWDGYPSQLAAVGIQSEAVLKLIHDVIVEGA